MDQFSWGDSVRRHPKALSRWHRGQSCTNNQTGPVRLGCSAVDRWLPHQPQGSVLPRHCPALLRDQNERTELHAGSSKVREQGQDIPANQVACRWRQRHADHLIPILISKRLASPETPARWARGDEMTAHHETKKRLTLSPNSPNPLKSLVAGEGLEPPTRGL